jgi:predicted TIM-barrel fold metal-dependent hydrolase
MKLICIEEHAVDPAIMRAAQPKLDEEAPYMRLQSLHSSTVPVPEGRLRPVGVAMNEAVRLGTDLGDGRIADMDQHGIDMQIVSWSAPVQLAPQERAVALAEAANDRLAKAVAAQPGRLSGFATLPWQAPHSAVDELNRAATELGLKGVLLLGRPGDTFLDDPRYAPILAKLADLQVPLYLHPFHPLPQVQRAYYAGLPDEVSAQLSLAGWGWHHEAGIHVLRLILSGTFERFPELQVISGHWGNRISNSSAKLLV